VRPSAGGLRCLGLNRLMPTLIQGGQVHPAFNSSFFGRCRVYLSKDTQVSNQTWKS
jgi:hypothetical protein